MELPRIYADFNSIEATERTAPATSIRLTGYGTLASLSKQKLSLKEGLRAIFFEPNDIEVEGIAHFELEKKGSTGGEGEWLAVIDTSEIRESSLPELPFHEHLCFECGTNIFDHLERVGRSYSENCPHCHTSIMEPLKGPNND